MARESLRGANVADLHGQAHGVGKQVLDLLELLRVLGEPGGQNRKRVRQQAGLLQVQASGQCQRPDHPVPDPLGTRRRGSQVTARRGEIAAMEADDGGDAEIAAGSTVFRQGQGLHLSHHIVPSPGVEGQLVQCGLRLRHPDDRT